MGTIAIGIQGSILAGPIRKNRTEKTSGGDGIFPDHYRGGDLIVYGHWGDAIINRAGWPEAVAVGGDVDTTAAMTGAIAGARSGLQNYLHIWPVWSPTGAPGDTATQ